MKSLGVLLRAAKQPHVLKASLRTALVVGLVLNLINQGGALWGTAPFSLPHLLMNFVVPFCVSSYSAARNEVARGFVA